MSMKLRGKYESRCSDDAHPRRGRRVGHETRLMPRRWRMRCTVEWEISTPSTVFMCAAILAAPHFDERRMSSTRSMTLSGVDVGLVSGRDDISSRPAKPCSR